MTYHWNHPALLAAVVSALPTLAAAELSYDTGDGGNILFYGQFDPAYLSFDDGVSTTSDIVDNTNSNSRVGLWYRLPTDYGSFAINLETALGLRPSAGLSQVNTPDALDWDRTDIRKVEAIWKTDQFGTFSIGQGSMATDGVSGFDLSGTTLVLYNSIPDTAASFLFRTSAGALSTRTIAGAFSAFDGPRKARVRYDTPVFNGFKVSVGYGEEVLRRNVDESVTDIAISYAGEFGDTKVVGGIGYAYVDFGSGVERNDTIGSISFLHASGFNATFAAGDRRETGYYYYGKLGYRANWFSAGTTSIAIDYYDGTDKVSAGSESSSVGIGVVQKFDNANVEAYLGYREYSLSEVGTTYRDASSVLFGARWKF